MYASLRHARRCISSRPGQPLRLTSADRGAAALRVPGSLLTPEAERLGATAPAPGLVLSPRAVPADAGAAAAARAAYSRALAAARAGFAAEVAASAARAARAAADWRAGVRARKAEAAGLKAVRAAARGASVAADRERARGARAIRADQGARAVALAAARADEARGRWLAALLADAAERWVPEDKIDEASDCATARERARSPHPPAFYRFVRRLSLLGAGRRARAHSSCGGLWAGDAKGSWPRKPSARGLHIRSRPHLQRRARVRAVPPLPRPPSPSLVSPRASPRPAPPRAPPPPGHYARVLFAEVRVAVYALV
jgi:hypothetical protein